MKASSSRKLARPAEEVWRIAGRFNSLPDISGMTYGSELLEGGRVRKLTPDGSHPAICSSGWFITTMQRAASAMSSIAVNDVPGHGLRRGLPRNPSHQGRCTG